MVLEGRTAAPAGELRFPSGPAAAHAGRKHDSGTAWLNQAPSPRSPLSAQARSGASWAAYFLSRGLRVAVWDPAPNAGKFVRSFVDRAWPTLQALGAPAAEPAGLSFHPDPATCVIGAQFVQESAPERTDAKRALFATLEHALPPDVVVASSSSGLMMTDLARNLRTPGRFVIGHPFNPPHLIPLVEVVGGERTTAETVAFCVKFYRHIGKHPIHLRKEAPGHLANRLQSALWREAVHAVAEGVATVADVDAGRCLRSRPALGADGAASDLSPGRRRGRHGPLHGASRPSERGLVAFARPTDADAPRFARPSSTGWRPRPRGRACQPWPPNATRCWWRCCRRSGPSVRARTSGSKAFPLGPGRC